MIFKYVFFVITALLIVASNLLAHEEPPKTLREKELAITEANKIKALNIKSSVAWKVVNNNKFKYLQTKYDEDGFVSSIILFKEDGTVDSKEVYDRDERGNMFLYSNYDSNDQIVEQIEYAFDRKGRVKASTNYENKKIDSSFSYEFNDLNNTVVFKKYKATEELEYSIDYIYSGKADITDLVDVKKYNPFGKLELSVVYEYSEDGKITAKTVYSSDSALVHKFLYVYENDLKAQITKILPENKIGFVQNFKYDDNGKLLQITALDADNKVTSQIDYDYEI
ncbi:MAG: hypothetical protein WCQ47_02535 [bacterium]